MTIKEIWTKYKPYVIGLLIFLVIGWIALREIRIKKLSGRYAGLQVSFLEAQKDRDAYKKTGVQLQLMYDSIQKVKDYLEKELFKKESELYVMKKKHQQEIDSLLNKEVPTDTVYVRLQPLFPNYDNGILEYPFSGTQIRQVYSVALNYPRLKEEYGLQTNVLNNCYILNNAFEDSENNLKAQIGNYKNDILSADGQIKIQSTQIKLLNRNINRKGAWNFVWKFFAVSGWTFFALK